MASYGSKYEEGKVIGSDLDMSDGDDNNSGMGMEEDESYASSRRIVREQGQGVGRQLHITDTADPGCTVT